MHSGINNLAKCTPNQLLARATITRAEQFEIALTPADMTLLQDAAAGNIVFAAWFEQIVKYVEQKIYDLPKDARRKFMAARRKNLGYKISDTHAERLAEAREKRRERRGRRPVSKRRFYFAPLVDQEAALFGGDRAPVEILRAALDLWITTNNGGKNE